jgi:rSAM/selenodomain-associated transferase 2
VSRPREHHQLSYRVDHPLLSVIIPTWNEGDALGGLLTCLRGLRAQHELIVVDGGSGDDTTAIARAMGATVIDSEACRGLQLRIGAAAARAPCLCFLHADIRLDTHALADVDTLASSGAAGAYAFRLRIGSDGWSYRLIEAGANLRSRIFGLPYGDQGLIVGREVYEVAGGFPAQPLMEDVALVRALKRFSRVHLLDSTVMVSGRRWAAEGPLRRSARNLTLLARYFAGQSPEVLARSYRSRPSSP